MFKIVALCSVIALCNAGLLPAQLAYNNHQEYEEHAPANYQFEYSVHDSHTGDIKQQQETRQGDSVQGSYSLVEPDGLRRIVHYTADEHSGFNAVVEREGSVHPQPVAHAPVLAAHSVQHAPIHQATLVAAPQVYAQQVHAPVLATHSVQHAQQAYVAPQVYSQQVHAPVLATHSVQHAQQAYVAPQVYSQQVHTPVVASHSVQHAPVLTQQAYIAPQLVAHSAIQPVHQQGLSHGYSQQVLGHGYAQQHAAPLAHAQSYSTSSITNHGVHSAYAH